MHGLGCAKYAGLGQSQQYTATLRRKLTANGISYRDLSTTYRVARLKDLLATDMPLIAIAEHLGLSDERSLRRFCVTHLGTAPASYRGIRS